MTLGGEVEKATCDIEETPPLMAFHGLVQELKSLVKRAHALNKVP